MNNYQILVSDWVQDQAPRFSSSVHDDDRFEILVCEQLLKNVDPTFDEISQGIVDGGNDGGIDAVFITAEGALIDDEFDLENFPEEGQLKLHIFQVKNTSSFTERAVTSISASMDDLLQLEFNEERARTTYNTALLQRFQLFRNVFRETARKFPRWSVNYKYVTRGDSPNSQIISRATTLVNKTKDLLGTSVDASFEFIGARELNEIITKREASTLELTCAETPQFTGSSGVLALSKLTDYATFLMTSTGSLNHRLFEFNVRDYQGSTEINKEIKSTLDHPENEDFWWLNNGITITCTRCNPAGKVLHIENPQIVNGLQTSTEIFKKFSRSDDQNDTRTVLIRILTPPDESSRDRIVKATNSQTAVQASSLRASDPFQYDIERFLLGRGYFYDRRKNYYKNQGKPADKIVGITQLAQAFISIVLQRPDDARARPTSLLKTNERYSEVFRRDIPLNCYLNCHMVMKKIEMSLRENNLGQDRATLNNAKYHVAMGSAILWLEVDQPTVNNIAESNPDTLEDGIIIRAFEIWRELLDRWIDKHSLSEDVVAKNRDFVEELIDSFRAAIKSRSEVPHL